MRYENMLRFLVVPFVLGFFPLMTSEPGLPILSAYCLLFILFLLFSTICTATNKRQRIINEVKDAVSKAVEAKARARVAMNKAINNEDTDSYTQEDFYDGTYFGEIDENRKLTGCGIICDKVGEYGGQLLGGIPNGYGVYIWKKEHVGSRYRGQNKHGEPHGYGEGRNAETNEVISGEWQYGAPKKGHFYVEKLKGFPDCEYEEE